MPKILIPLDADPASMTTMAGARAIMGNRPWTVRLIHSGADPEGKMRAYLDDAAARLQAEGHFVTVVMAEGPSDVERERAVAAADEDEALPALTSAADAASYLDGVSQRYADRVRFGQAVKDSGRATSEAIVEAAREQRADLVVLTSQGTSGARKEGLGRVAEAMAQTSTVPVMIARPTPTSKVPFGRGALLKRR
jgi:nucleotide-binding universal stress UspA family protein